MSTDVSEVHAASIIRARSVFIYIFPVQKTFIMAGFVTPLFVGDLSPNVMQQSQKLSYPP
jgi:hypothetical protein